MSLIARRTTVTDDQRRAHDRNRHWVPVVVVVSLLVVAYLWTDWMAAYPPPGHEWVSNHPLLARGLDEGGHLDNDVWIAYGPNALGSDSERRILLLLTGLCFLLSYYLPLGWKKQPVVLLTLVGVGWVFGVPSLTFMLAWHMLAYGTFHSPAVSKPGTVLGIALIAICAWSNHANQPLDWFLRAVLTTPVLAVVYAYVYRPMLRLRAGAWMQTLVAHSALVYMTLALVWNWQAGSSTFPRVIGWFLFFWQWERLVMYRIDLRDGRVPADLPLFDYLATFFTPGFLSNVSWLNRIPKGYAYLANSFLARDKNLVVLSGLRLVAISVVAFYLRPILLRLFKLGMEAVDLPRRAGYGALLETIQAGVPPSVTWVWAVLIYQFLTFYLLWIGVAHLKVGLWRLMGYDIEPYFQKPFLSTNLLEWWKRYSFYYREFLVQAFYIPVFLRWFKKRPYLRVFVATIAAAGFGNMLFHLLEYSLYDGSNPDVWAAQLRTFPYYLMLAVGIALTQIWIMARGRRRRRPWTGGARIGLDVLAVAATVGYYVLIRPFHHIPLDDSVMDAVRVVVAALGIHI